MKQQIVKRAELWKRGTVCPSSVQRWCIVVRCVCKCPSMRERKVKNNISFRKMLNSKKQKQKLNERNIVSHAEHTKWQLNNPQSYAIIIMNCDCNTGPHRRMIGASGHITFGCAGRHQQFTSLTRSRKNNEEEVKKQGKKIYLMPFKTLLASLFLSIQWNVLWLPIQVTLTIPSRQQFTTFFSAFK